MGNRVTIFDDIDNNLDADSTVSFSIDGDDYEIDLADKNKDKLLAALKPYIDAARRVRSVSRSAAGGSSKPRSHRRSKEELDAIRHWAGKQGLPVSDRGRIPHEIEEAYHAAHAPRPAKTEPPAAKAPAKKDESKVVEPAFSSKG